MVQYFPVVTGSLTVNGDISVSGNVVVTGSMSGTSSLAANAELLSGTGSVGFTTTGSFTVASSSLSSRTTQIEAVYATTGSNSFRATQSITGSLTVTGQIVAQTINVQQVTSSIVYSSGSNVFGCDINSRQTFTGSFYQTGSVAIFDSSISIGSSCNPTYALDVYNRTGNVAMRLFQPSALSSDYNSMYFTGNHTCVTGYIGSAGSTTPNASLQNSFYMGVQNAYPLKFATSDTVRATITSGGITCFACQICAPGGLFNLSTTNGGFKVTGVAATPANLAYLANNYFVKFYTRPDQNYGITIFDQSEATAIQSADLVNGTCARSIALNPFGGNVGIGTTTPSDILDVQVCSNSTKYFFLRNTDNANGSSRAYFVVNSGNTCLHLMSLSGGVSCGGTYMASTNCSDFYFQAYPSGPIRYYLDKNGVTCFSCQVCTTKIGYNGYNGITAHDLVGHFDAGSTNIATLSGENAYTRVAAHIEWVSNYALAGTNMTMGYTIVDTRRGNSNTIWVNCACTILAYGDSPANPTFGWSGGVLSVSVPGSTGLSARFRITTYAATLTPNI